MSTTIEFELKERGKPTLKITYQAQEGKILDLLERVIQAQEFYTNHFPAENA